MGAAGKAWSEETSGDSEQGEKDSQEAASVTQLIVMGEAKAI